MSTLMAWIDAETGVVTSGGTGNGDPTQFRGCNLSGAEWAWHFAGATFNTNSGNRAEGTYWLSTIPADYDYLATTGLDFVRFQFSWELMQPVGGGPLDPTYSALILSRVNYLTSKGIYVMVEPHQFTATDTIGGAMYYGRLIDGTDGTVPTTWFGDMWTRVAQLFAGNPKVMFELINEPNTMGTMNWYATAQRGITAIRATGYTGRIFVPGNGYTAGVSWTDTFYDTVGSVSNAVGWLTLTDPLSNLVCSIHQYWDASSGDPTAAISVSNASTNLGAVTAWAVTNNITLHLGETGWIHTDVKSTSLKNSLFPYLAANPNWLGFSWWTYGSQLFWQGVSYALNSTQQPPGGTPSANMAIISPSFSFTFGSTTTGIDSVTNQAVGAGGTEDWSNTVRTGVNMVNMGDLKGSPWWGGITGPAAGTDYPIFSTQLMDWLVSKNVGQIRLLFSWEAMQKDLLGPLSNTGANGYLTYYQHLKATIDYLLSKGVFILLEMFQQDPNAAANFGSTAYDTAPCYKGTYIGSGAVTSAAFGDLWGKMAQLFSYDQRIAFGLINEPHAVGSFTTSVWFAAAQAAITAVRAAGINNWIWVPGMQWTDSGTFVSNGSAAAFLGLTDPAKRMGVSVHNYNGLLGVAGEPTNSMTAVTSWARANGVQIQVGELSVDAISPQNTFANAQTQWAEFVAFCATNSDVIRGWTWWATSESGWWWIGGHPFTLDNGVTSEVYLTLVASSLVNSGGSSAPPASVSSFPTNPTTPDYNNAHTYNNGTSDYYVFVPTAYDSTHNTPIKVLIWLQGSTGFGLGDVQGFSVNGQSFIMMGVGGFEGTSFNDNMQQGMTNVVNALASLKTQFNIDPLRVVLGGYSAGGDLTYLTIFNHASLFAGALTCNTDPFRDTTETQAQALSKGGWKFNVKHLLHTSDGNYTRTPTIADFGVLTTNGYPVTLVERPGTHSDANTDPDIKAVLLPQMDGTWVAPGTVSGGGGGSVSFVGTSPTRPALTSAIFKSGLKHAIDTTTPTEYLKASSTLTLDKGASFYAVVRSTNTDASRTQAANPPQTLFGDSMNASGVNVGFSAGAPQYSYTVSAARTYYNSTFTTVNDGLPHTVCWTHSTAGDLNVYVDGVLRDTFASVTYNVSTTFFNAVAVGYLSADPFLGDIAELMVFNGELTGQNVRDLHSRSTNTWY